MSAVHDSKLPIFDQVTSHVAEGRMYDERTCLELMRNAVARNSVDALSLLISLLPIACQPGLVEPEPKILPPLLVEALAQDMLTLAMPNDAAECSLYLLNYLEELRRKRQRGAPIPEKPTGELLERRQAHVHNREVHCGEAPKSRELLSLAREALELDPATGRPRAPRCGRVLLLQAHRLRKEWPVVGRALPDCDGFPLLDSQGRPGVEWPETPADLPHAQTCVETEHGGRGGMDLSLGGEAVPLQWVNEFDDASPPPIVFVRRCIDVDVRPDWLTKQAKACSMTQQEARNRATTDCSQTKFPGKPDSIIAECNHDCTRKRTCVPGCSKRQLQRGSPYRLQVFKHAMKGWCLRTLVAIPKDAFIMEYVAERISDERSTERFRDDPNVETYIMDLERQAKSTHLDALVVRNHAAFAAFACSKLLANMEKKAVLTNHWDATVPHVGFFARQAIEPGEELCYLRRDEGPKQGSDRNCCCFDKQCSGRL